MASNVVEGTGLFTGARTKVTLCAARGPITLAAGGVRAPLHAWRVVDTAQSTTLGCGPARVRMVEHLLAALAGLGIHHGLAVEVEGAELPLLDGASRAWCTYLRTVAPGDLGAPGLTVVRPAQIEHEQSVYTFAPGTLRVEVEVDFGVSYIDRTASWTGDPEDFVNRIASARTFARARDLETWSAAGVALHANRESAVILGPDRAEVAGAPFQADEPARHKLLDLLGDLFASGGPPMGRVHAKRPGHAATHAVLAEALSRGILARTTLSNPSRDSSMGEP